MQRPYRAVFFDLDGTLIDSFDGIASLFLKALGELGVRDCTAQEIRALIGIPLDRCFARFVPENEVERAVALYRREYEVRMLDISPAFPGAEELLRALKASGMTTGVISNKRGSAVRKILAHKGWPVDIVVGEGEGVASKPAPDMLWHAAGLASVAREAVLYVGDSRLDAEAARAAGVAFAGVTTGELKTADFAAFPHVGVFDRPSDLQAYLLPLSPAGTAEMNSEF